MTQADQQLADDKMRAEIAKLMAEVGHTDEKLRAEVSKLVAETRKISRETDWYIAIVASTMTLAIVAVVKLFF